MPTAIHLDADTWLVGQPDAEGNLQEGIKIAVRPGGTAEDAVAAYAEVSTAPTGELLGQDQQAARLAAARAECSRRIFGVADSIAQINLAAAAAAGLLTAEQMTVYRTGLNWVTEMRGTWPPLANTNLPLADDANWPAVPAGVVELASEF